MASNTLQVYSLTAPRQYGAKLLIQRKDAKAQSLAKSGPQPFTMQRCTLYYCFLCALAPWRLCVELEV